MPEDAIGVQLFPVQADRIDPPFDKLVLDRLDVMQRELQHVQNAISRLRGALSQGAAPTRALAQATMDSRNWVLSVMMSHAYVQSWVEGDRPPNPNNLAGLAERAARTGDAQALTDRIQADTLRRLRPRDIDRLRTAGDIRRALDAQPLTLEDANKVIGRRYAK